MINTQTATEYWNATGEAQPEAIGLTPERCNVTTDWTIQKQRATAQKAPGSYADPLNASQEQCATGVALQGQAAWQQAIDGFRPTLQGAALQRTHTRCECHDFTQARWKMSIEGQLNGASKGVY